MKKILLISFVIGVLCNGILAQTIDLEQEIMQQQPSKSVMISKARQLLMDRVIEEDWSKVAEVKDYLLTREDTNYIALYPMEYWYILYQLQSYPELLMDIRGVDSLSIAWFNRRVRPEYDLLMTTLYKQIKNRQTLICQQIKQSELGEKEKDFLNLHLNWLLTRDNTQKMQDSLNESADAFLASYAPTVYDDFIKTYIREKYEVNSWGITYDISAGAGIFDNKLKEHYSNPFLFNCTLGVLYDKFDLSFGAYFGNNKNKNDIPYSQGVREANSRTSLFLGYATLGYAAFENDRIKLTPYMGVGGASIKAPIKEEEDNEALKEISIGTGASYVGGIKLDVKLGKNHLYRSRFYSNESYLCITLKYTYGITTFQRKHPGMIGNMHAITVGIGGISRSARRVKD